METLTIHVNCNLRDRTGPPQLGIHVEAPYSVALQMRQQQAKDYCNHDYQNCVPASTTQSKHNDSRNGFIIEPNHRENSTASYMNQNRNKQATGTPGAYVQRGLQITKIQPDSVIDRNGHFKVGDIIVEANNINLDQHTFQQAQKILKEIVQKSSHKPIVMRVLRKPLSSSSIPSSPGSQSTVIERNNRKTSSTSSSNFASPSKASNNNNLNQTTSSVSSTNSTRHIAGPLNTRKIGTIYRIDLGKSKDGGFGIKIAERDNMFGRNRPIYITAITTTGSAYKDGRLKEGDMLLEINGCDLSNKTQTDVTRMLKDVCFGQSVEFVVSRQDNILQKDSDPSTSSPVKQENGHENNTSLIDFDVPDQDDFVFTESINDQFEKKIDSILDVATIDPPGIYTYDILINDTKSAGLGLSLKYPTLGCKNLGIWIKKVITGGAAWRDSRLRPDDQILSINGINLMGLSNTEAAQTLTAAVCRGIGPEATSNTIRLQIQRRDPSLVAKILHGTNDKMETSDTQIVGHNKSTPSSLEHNNTQDSYQTAYDNTLHSRSHSSNDTEKSSNQNTHNDSAMSPQTQASNSYDELNGSDKTNDTSSAISQITDFTSVAITTPERDSTKYDNLNDLTIPKSLEVEPASSTQSCDEDSILNTGGEEKFQRHGFGRQSISEKRHAKLMAQSTDTFKRNQKIRQERERQRQLEQQFEKQSLENTRPKSIVNADNQQQFIVPRAGTLRLARNRKTNDSFRAAVDRSYEVHSNHYQPETMHPHHIQQAHQRSSMRMYQYHPPLNFHSISQQKLQPDPMLRPTIIRNSHQLQQHIPLPAIPVTSVQHHHPHYCQSAPNHLAHNHLVGWHPPQDTPAPNGLWVVDPAYSNNNHLYATQNQHVGHQHSAATFQPSSYVYPMNRQVHQPHVFQGNVPTMTQPQHIYYYDF